MRMRFLGMLAAILLCHTTHAEDEIFEYFGDHYVIHVDQLSPDPEMTLMDVRQRYHDQLHLGHREY